ncbi:MAG TPA: hypothetical protein VJQ79_04250, partial [Acidimicrobiia bacterium]|nr:hypothetical protein [Acidimicrobiia bacterium]
MELSQTGWRRLSFVLLAVTTLATVGSIVLRPIMAGIAISEGSADLVPSVVPFEVVSLPFAGAAHLILRRVPNRVGLLLHGIGLNFVAAALGIYFLILHRFRWRLGVVGDLVANWVGYLWMPALVFLIVFMPLIFPTGHVPGPRWRWVAWGGAAFLVGGFIAITQQTLAGTEPLTGPLWRGLMGLLMVSAVGAWVSVVFRYRDAKTIERQQIKGVAFTQIVAGALIALSLIVGASQPLPLPVLLLIGVLTIVSIPVSIAMAIARFRLYEIDRIISRTVAYTLVAATLAIVYAVPVLVIPGLIGQSSDLVVAAATLAGAAVFNPVRRRVQRFVDRH